MACKPIKNSKPRIWDDKYFGICPIHNKQAVVTIHMVGEQLSKTDLQKTYHESGRCCSLLGRQWNVCLDSCPLVPGK